MANPEWDNYDPKNRDKAMQELTHYYQNIITLKSGRQIEICTQYPLSKTPIWKGTHYIPGFTNKGLSFIEKTVKFKYDEVALIESIRESCIAQTILWPEEIDPGAGQKIHSGTTLDDITSETPSEPNIITLDDITSKTPVPAEQVESKDGLIRKKKQPLAEHRPDCAIHNNPPCGFSSSVSDCDCGAIVACMENKPTGPLPSDLTRNQE